MEVLTKKLSSWHNSVLFYPKLLVPHIFRADNSLIHQKSNCLLIGSVGGLTVQLTFPVFSVPLPYPTGFQRSDLNSTISTAAANNNNNSFQSFILACCINIRIANYRYSTKN
jgi:hypothetical protein